MKKQRVYKRKELGSRRGVALIMVVGLVAVLLVLAMTFALSMRMERKQSSSFVKSVQTQTMISWAVSKSVRQLEANKNHANDLFHFYPVISTSRPRVTINYSRDPNQRPADASLNPPQNMARSSSLAYIPAEMRPDADMAIPGLKWQRMIAAGDQVGRFAYVVVDCSPYINASVLGQADRGFGLNGAAEINGAGLGSFEDPSDWTSFTSYLDGVVRLESLEEIAISDGYNSSVTTNELFHYSYCRQGAYAEKPDGSGLGLIEYYESGTPPGDIVQMVDVSDPVITITDLLPGFQALGLTAAEATILANNFMDYRDFDNDTLDLAGPSCEAVPMLSELVITNKLVSATDDGSGTGTFDITFETSFAVELAYPFIYQPLADDYKVKIDYTLTSGGATGVTTTGSKESAVFDASSFLTSRFASEIITFEWTGTAPDPAVTALSDLKVTLTSVEVLRGAAGGPAPPPPPPVVIIPPLLSVSKAVDVVVDRLTGLEFTIAGTYALKDDEYTTAKENNDPRFNWDLDDASQWRGDATTTPTLGAINVWSKTELGEDYTDGVDDEDTAMYTSNKNLLFVGELGYLAYAPWKTIRLYYANGISGHPVNNYFTANPVEVLHDRVPLNSKNPLIHQAVFADMPIVPFMDESQITNRVSMADALTIGEAIVDEVTDPDDRLIRYFMNPAEIVWSQDIWASINTVLGPSFENDLYRESVYRCIENVYATRLGMYTMLVIAEPLGPVPKESSLGSTKAAVVYYRDPFPDPSDGGRHRTHIRSFETIMDDL